MIMFVVVDQSDKDFYIAGVYSTAGGAMASVSDVEWLDVTWTQADGTRWPRWITQGEEWCIECHLVQP